MKEKLDAISKNHTWDLVTLPLGKSMVGCKWIYKIKTHSDGSIERYKARFVAKGFTQEYVINYEETFTLVAQISSVRAFLAIAATNRWDIFSNGCKKNSFLNGNLSEEVYMQSPHGLFIEPNKFCHLRCALYALNKLYELGLPSSALPSLAWITLPVIMILPYFFVASTNDLFCFSYMWMIWS